MPSRFQVVPAAYVVLRRVQDGTEQVLLQLRQGTGFMDGHWACGAAGHVESGESVLEAAAREACEELGIGIAAEDLVPLTAMHRTGGTGEWIDERVDFFLECRSWSGDPRLQEADRAADLRWFALDALPDPVVPHEYAVLASLLSGGPTPIVTHGFARHLPDSVGGSI